MLLQKYKNFYNNMLFYTWNSLVSNRNWTLMSQFAALFIKMQNIFAYVKRLIYYFVMDMSI